MQACCFKAVIGFPHFGAFPPINTDFVASGTFIQVVQFFLIVVHRINRRNNRSHLVIAAIVIVLDFALFVLVHGKRTGADPRFYIFVLRHDTAKVICLERANQSRIIPASVIAISRTRPGNIIKLKVLIRKLKARMTMINVVQHQRRAKEFVQVKRKARRRGIDGIAIDAQSRRHNISLDTQHKANLGQAGKATRIRDIPIRCREELFNASVIVIRSRLTVDIAKHRINIRRISATGMLSVNAQRVIFRAVIIRPEDESRIRHVCCIRIHIDNRRRENRSQVSVASVIARIEDYALRTVRNIGISIARCVCGNVVVRNRRRQQVPRLCRRAYAFTALEATSLVIIHGAIARRIIPVASRCCSPVVIDHHPVRICGGIARSPMFGFRNFARHSRRRIRVANIDASRHIVAIVTESRKAVIVFVRCKVFVEAVIVMVVIVCDDRIIVCRQERQLSTFDTHSLVRFRRPVRKHIRALIRSGFQLINVTGINRIIASLAIVAGINLMAFIRRIALEINFYFIRLTFGTVEFDVQIVDFALDRSVEIFAFVLCRCNIRIRRYDHFAIVVVIAFSLFQSHRSRDIDTAEPLIVQDFGLTANTIGNHPLHPFFGKQRATFRRLNLLV